MGGIQPPLLGVKVVGRSRLQTLAGGVQPPLPQPPPQGGAVYFFVSQGPPSSVPTGPPMVGPGSMGWRTKKFRFSFFNVLAGLAKDARNLFFSRCRPVVVHLYILWMLNVLGQQRYFYCYFLKDCPALPWQAPDVANKIFRCCAPGSGKKKALPPHFYAHCICFDFWLFFHMKNFFQARH